MKSRLLLKILLPVLLFVMGNNVFAQVSSTAPGSTATVYGAGTEATLVVSTPLASAPVSQQITVTAPAGYEVSLSSGSGFAASVGGPTLFTDGAGLLAGPVTIYLRIITTTNVGSVASGTISITNGTQTADQVTGINAVSVKPITIATPTIAARAYDGTTTVGAITLGAITGLVGGETLTVTPTGTAYGSANVGAPTSTVSYAIANGGGGGLASNYSALANSVGVVGSITAKSITIATPTIAARAYDGTTAVGAITLGAITGLVGGETLTVTPTGTAYGSANVGAPTSTVSYAIANGGGGGLATNYSALANSVGVVGSITAKAITIAAPTIASKVFDGLTATGVITIGAITGLVGGETLTVTPTGTAYSSANVGAYTSTVSYAIANGGGGGLATNYSALANSLLVPGAITPASLTITAIALPKVYGVTLTDGAGKSTAVVVVPGVLASATGLVAGNTATSCTLTYDPLVSVSTANAGVVGAATPSAFVGGGGYLASNYAITYTPANITVVVKPVTITANNRNKDHGDALPAGPTAGSTAFTTSGMANGETIASVSITYTAGHLSGDALGAYPLAIVPTAATGGTHTPSNYAFTYANGNLTVVVSTNAHLSAFDCDRGPFNPGPTIFHRDDIDYDIYVLNAVNKINVRGTRENIYATLKSRINNTGFSPEPWIAPVPTDGVYVPGGGYQVAGYDLQMGDNMIDFTCTAEDGITELNYRLKVSREAIWVWGGGGGGGGGGGLESKSLGDAVAKRIFNKAINNENGPVDYNALPLVETRSTQNRVMGSDPAGVTLSAIMPNITSNIYSAYNSSPKDLTAITNAKEVLAFDFTANKEVKAVAFATKTLGELYDHTKPICDRLKGATLAGVETINVQGYDFVKYSIKYENGNVEYATSFTVGTKAGRSDFSLQSIYLSQDYTNDETMYNFQLWAGSNSLVTDMIKDVLTKLKAIAPVSVIKTASLPVSYVESGKREGMNVSLQIKNATPNTSGYFTLADKASETSASTVLRNIPFTINANGKSIVTIPMEDKYESILTMYMNGKVTDVVYMSDGTWAVDYNKATTVLGSFNVINDSKRTYSTDEFPLFRNIELKANSSDFVSVVKLLRGGGAEMDLNAYKGLKFTASGGYNLHVTLVKNGIVDYKNQYSYDVSLENGERDYYIPLDKFKSLASAAKIDAKDVSTVIFTVEVGNGKNSSINTTLSHLAFTKEDLSYLASLDAKEVAVYPNPVTGNKITVNFASAKDAELNLRITDMNGKVLNTKQVAAVKGMNTIQLPISNGLNGIHIVSLEGAGIKYNPKKVAIMN